MPDVVAPNGTQMVTAHDSLLMVAGVSLNTTAVVPDALHMVAALGALQWPPLLMQKVQTLLRSRWIKIEWTWINVCIVAHRRPIA
jgi:hypothetical protein